MKQADVGALHLCRVAAVSPPVRVGNVPHNADTIWQWVLRAESEGADLVVFPELCITGYSLGDLIRSPDLLSASLSALSDLAERSSSVHPLVVVGLPIAVNAQIFNCAAVIGGGGVHGIVPKTYLPSSNEYYEHRWFTSGVNRLSNEIEVNHHPIPFGTDLLFGNSNGSTTFGIEICEDLWSVHPPSGLLTQHGATIILNPSASNEIVGKAEYRRNLVRQQSARTWSAYAYASAGPTESTTDTVFSGHCLICEAGDISAESPRLALQGAWALADVDIERLQCERRNSTTFTQNVPESAMRYITVPLHQARRTSILKPLPALPFVPVEASERSERCEDILLLQATALAVRMQRAAARHIVLGVSGGLDSTLALLVCIEACELLGLAHHTVIAVTMPGLGTSMRTLQNARLLAKHTGSKIKEIDISDSVLRHFEDVGHSSSVHNVVYENAQARRRTHILMDTANMENGIVVGTADLSELALGWCTFNADHMAMYHVNAGVPKTLVRYLISWYALSKASPELRSVLEDVLETPVSPELLPLHSDGSIQQHTEQILGPYEVHDFFLYHFVRLQRSVHSTYILACYAFAELYSAEQLRAWFVLFLERFFANQFKRSSMPDGVKIGSLALSPRADWRMPSDADVQLWRSQL